MISNFQRPAAFALTVLALSSCSDQLTEPSESAVTAAPSAATEAAVAATSNTWIARANMPSERLGLTSAWVTSSTAGSRLYAIGGSNRLFAQPSGPTDWAVATVQAFNPATNGWTNKAPLPVPLYKTNGAGVIDGKIYVSGGRPTGDKRYVNTLYVYDPALNSWSRKKDMPADGNWGGVTGVINGQLYVLTCEQAEDCSEHSVWRLYRYNPTTDQWALLSTPPMGLGLPMGGVIGGKFYVTGGPSGALAAYDPATDSWTQKASIPGGRRWGGAGVAYHAQLYIIGGFERNADFTSRTVNKTSVYDPATDSWTEKAPMPSARFDLTASLVTVNGQTRIELVGGARPGNNVQYVR